ncbi:MAG: hypothetical protein ACTHNU_07975 [Gaiellales bacterium]
MRRFVCAIALAAVAVVVSASASAGAATGSSLKQLVAQDLKARWVSQGAHMWLNPPRSTGAGPTLRPGASVALGTNVDAADPNEDLFAGQSETAIAAAPGGRVLAAWNDATAFGIQQTTRLKASGTGVGYSTDGGRSFTDLIGLRNPNPDQQWTGDPAIVSIDGGAHFIVGSLYDPSFFACEDGQPSSATIALEVLTPNATGGMSMGTPVVPSDAGDVCKLGLPGGSPKTAFLDKDLLSWDQSSRTLVVSFTRFYLTGNHSGQGEIDIARAHVPANATTLSASDFQTIRIWSEDRFDENEGAAPAVAPGGTTYVTWERNLDTNLFNGDPRIYEHIAMVPAGASSPSKGNKTDPMVVTQGQFNSTPSGGVKSLDGVVIAGYNRGTGNDFPRIAWDKAASRVVVVWNDASAHPLGDIWARSFGPDLGGPSGFGRVNSDADFTLHFLPAVSVRADGSICTSWYDRRNFAPDSPLTDVYGECRPTVLTQVPDFRITTGASDWTNTSSLIVPNFGDYTDNTSVGNRTYYTWSDGRLGVPQPFVDHNG